MKILAITDIHKDYEAARSSGVIESPDLILDCGDHEEIVNLFNECPHFYIRGNHEPEEIHYQQGDYLLPSYLPNGVIVKFSDNETSVSFFGIDGNYGSKEMLLQVNPRILSCLKKIDPQTIDILLLHESPLNVAKNSREYSLAMQVLEEVNRLQPKLVISGHTNKYSEQMTEKGVQFVTLPDMSCGYLVITVEGQTLKYEKKTAHFGTRY